MRSGMRRTKKRNSGWIGSRGQDGGILGAAFEPMYLKMHPACPDYSGLGVRGQIWLATFT
jgi:hypothetical protein